MLRKIKIKIIMLLESNSHGEKSVNKTEIAFFFFFRKANNSKCILELTK